MTGLTGLTGLPRLPVPDYGGGSLADVLPAALAHLEDSPRVCVLMIDGLGWNALREAADAAPYLTSLCASPASRRITSVFPTTTPIALTSFGTGLTPGEHGISGLFLRIAAGQVVNLLAMPAETDLAVLQPLATIFEQADRAGITVTRVGPGRFDGEGLTQAALRGGSYAAVESVGELVVAAGAVARRGARSLTYVYVGSLDATGHRRGCRSEAWREELAHVDRLAERLAAALPPGTMLLVTSDHGMVDVPLASRWDLAVTPSLRDGVEVITGDMRAVNVHAQPGAAADVAAAWQAELGSQFWVLTGDQAVESGLYGPTVRDDVRPRIGDVLAVAAGDAAVCDSRRLPPYVTRLIGLHGSVTPDELDIPLLVHAT